MTRMQHLGWFFSRGFGPQGWGRGDWLWGHDWTKPALYQESVRTLEQAGFDLVIPEDALSLGSPETLGLRVRSAYGGPKLDPLLLTPYLFAATQRIGIAPTVNAGITPPYLAARQAATLAHLSGDRFGMNVVTDTGSARHVGAPVVAHDVAYDRADEWVRVCRELWHSWDDDALIEDPATGRYADPSKIHAHRHRGEHFDVTGPLNAPPLDADPVIVSPGGSGRGLDFAGAHSDVQLALAPLEPAAIRAYREKVLAAAAGHGRTAADVRILFVLKPVIAPSREEAERLVAASAHPDDAALRTVAEAWSSDTETDLTALDLDAPIPAGTFGDHVSQGSVRGLLAGVDDPTGAPLRAVLTRRARLGLIGKGEGLVGTAQDVADLVERLGEEADNDGVILSGDLHPTTVHRMLDELVPELRSRGVLRRELSGDGLRANLFDF